MNADQHLELLILGIAVATLALIVLAAAVAAHRRSGRPRPTIAAAPVSRSAPGRGRELGSIEHFARMLDRSRRLVAAEQRVGQELGTLRGAGWMVERNVITGAHRVPFILLGPGGLFVVCATDGAWTMHDLEALTAAGDELRAVWPHYHGPVVATICLAFDDAEPRSWHSPAVAGGWVVGIGQLATWLHARATDTGISPADIATLHAASGPHWQRKSVPRLPLVRNIG
ncbi:hypothetical protein DVA67_020530 [Solirubrobacter sp. CPCC 204708]|uniref:NERD domain-containing protein n=1 Tax=Solirubrobacter deserti TaxID=2282478 RepID=A0ABT4RNF1_9ACTN|nr:hypothetical protein [Solirubrobacter deserti]MBE2318380.1 hypothetical protein [Solirubrobacter deserti]MDA0140100.1 hypothetical protein [Solirubrobacter deserti]